MVYHNLILMMLYKYVYYQYGINIHHAVGSAGLRTYLRARYAYRDPLLVEILGLCRLHWRPVPDPRP